MLRRLQSLPRVMREEDGFTLVEMLVAMVAGIVVVGALVALLTISLDQETQITDRVQDDRAGRSAMNVIVEELRSSCTGFGAVAIQAPSTTPVSPLAAIGPQNLWFLSAYGNSTSGEASVERVVEHDITWSSTKTSNTGKSLGTLYDYSFVGSGEPPNWLFGTLSTVNATKRVTLATNVVPSATNTIFQYWRYDTTATDTSTYGKLIQVPESEVPTYAANRKIAEVTISYEQAPEDGDTRSGHLASFQGSAVLRLTPPEAATEGTTCA